MMAIYVAEIDGLAICAFDAENAVGAEMLAEEKWFRADLLVYERLDGKPLWNGKSKIETRLALPEEAASHHSSKIAMMTEEPDFDESEEWVHYLVPIHDPTDDEFDDDD